MDFFLLQGNWCAAILLVHYPVFIHPCVTLISHNFELIFELKWPWVNGNADFSRYLAPPSGTQGFTLTPPPPILPCSWEHWGAAPLLAPQDECVWPYFSAPAAKDLALWRFSRPLSLVFFFFFKLGCSDFRLWNPTHLSCKPPVDSCLAAIHFPANRLASSPQLASRLSRRDSGDRKTSKWLPD